MATWRNDTDEHRAARPQSTRRASHFTKLTISSATIHLVAALSTGAINPSRSRPVTLTTILSWPASASLSLGVRLFHSLRMLANAALT
jgi:hypothetical protein